MKYKLLLGTLIIGVTSTSAQSQKQVMTNDTILAKEPTTAEITCYKPALPPKKVNVSDLVKVEGCVKDSIGNPLIGVIVRVKDTANSTLTDLDGNFTLNTKLNDLIVFFYVGYLTKEISASKMKESTTIVMETDSIELSCYIVVVDPVKRQLPQITKENFEDREVKGKVKDKQGEPLIGVEVAVVGTNKGVISDLDGNFSIKVRNNNKLKFSYIGYEEQEIAVSKIKNEIEIILKESDYILCYEVVVGLPNPWDDIYAPGAKPITKLSYNEIYKKPLSPVGDLNAFEKWVQSNIQYSEQMKEDKIEGEVIISFAIDKKGRLVDKKVIGKLSKEADKEALRALSLSDKWVPGIHYEKPIKTTMTITLHFNCR